MKTFKTEIKWGVILATLTFLVFLISYLLGWQEVETLSKHLSIAFGAFLIGNLTCLWLGLKEKKGLMAEKGFAYVDALKSGVLITIIAALLGAIFLCCFICCINTNFLQVTTDYNIEQKTLMEGEAISCSTFLTEFITHSLVIGGVFTLVLSFFARVKN